MNTRRDELLAALVPKARAAARAAVDWSGVIEADDLEQEIYLKLLELSDRALSDVADHVIYGDRSAFKFLRDTLAPQIAAEYRDDYELFTGNYYYSGEEVRRLLTDGVLVFGDAATATERADITKAMAAIPAQYREALVRRYVEMIDDRADKDTLVRARRALTREMNKSNREARREHSGPALRREQA